VPAKRAFLPYSELLPKLSAVVSNGGYGTVQQALGHRLPLVVSGRTEDKPEVCARVGWSGVGLNLRSHSHSPRRIRSAVRRVLADPCYQQAAERISVEQAEYDGVSTAASLLKELAATRTAVTRVEVDQL
jgi:UDP:flavonoid glycosyltransferase YjiC (YdhE family)